MRYQNCSVCGFDHMPYPPVPYRICPCCGTEFGVDDYVLSHEELRQAWIHTGMHWWDRITSPPAGWHPMRQLIAAGFGSDLVTRSALISATEETTARIVFAPMSIANLTRYHYAVGA